MYFGPKALYIHIYIYIIYIIYIYIYIYLSLSLSLSLSLYRDYFKAKYHNIWVHTFFRLAVRVQGPGFLGLRFSVWGLGLRLRVRGVGRGRGLGSTVTGFGGFGLIRKHLQRPPHLRFDESPLSELLVRLVLLAKGLGFRGLGFRV